MCITPASRPVAVLAAAALDQRRPHSIVRFGWDIRIPPASPVLLATEYSKSHSSCVAGTYHPHEQWTLGRPADQNARIRQMRLP
jgi:hypothetical protein